MKLDISPETCWLASEPVDFRCGIDGLCSIVLKQFGQSLKTGTFIFYSKDRKKIKVLSWHRNGFILIYKRLAKGKFYSGVDLEEGVAALDKEQLSWLLAGLDWQLMSTNTELTFQNYY